MTIDQLIQKLREASGDNWGYRYFVNNVYILQVDEVDVNHMIMARGDGKIDMNSFEAMELVARILEGYYNDNNPQL